MSAEILKRDQNHVTVLGGITNDVDQDVTMLRVDPITKRLLVQATGGSGGGTPAGALKSVQYNLDGTNFGGGTTPVFPTGSGVAFDYLNSVGYDTTDLLTDINNYATPLLIAPILTQNVSIDSYLLGFVTDVTVNGSADIAGVQGNYTYITYSGTGDMSDGMTGTQYGAKLRGNVNVPTLIGSYVQNYQESGHITDHVAEYLFDIDQTGGTRDNSVGLKIADITAGAISNISIQTGLGDVIFGTLAGTGTRMVTADTNGNIGTSAFVDNEVVARVSGTSWTLANMPVTGSVHLYANGQRLTPGAGNDYTILGVTITTSSSYSAGQLLADYRT